MNNFIKLKWLMFIAINFSIMNSALAESSENTGFFSSNSTEPGSHSTDDDPPASTASIDTYKIALLAIGCISAYSIIYLNKRKKII